MSEILQPLIWDGSTLAIPKASATQDGYLSRDNYVLFSGGILVPVTSFNTRTGEVILLEDDVLAALGYVPLNKHGDTMTGPLALAGPPSTALHAATKAYVDSTARSLLPGQSILSDYGASGSKATFTGTIANGSTALALTSSTHDFAIGQGIAIVGAGNLQAVNGNNLLVTRITAMAGAVLTLASPAIAPATAQRVQHDDTVAIQSAINAACAANNATLLVPPAFYRVNGPFTDYNSILKVPTNALTAAAKMLAIIGVNPPTLDGYTGPAPSTGAVIQSDRIGADANSSIISWGVFDPTPGFYANNTSGYIRNLTFRTYDNPQICALDMGMCQCHAYVEDVAIDTGMTAQDFAAAGGSQPTHNGFGLRMPKNGLSTMASIRHVEVNNYFVGMILSENTDVSHAYALRCKTAFRFLGTGFHATTGMFQTVQCSTVFEFLGPVATPVNLVVDIENVGGFWYSPAPGHEFYDPTNCARGKIEYISVESGTGTLLPAQVTGCTGVILTNLGNAT